MPKYLLLSLLLALPACTVERVQVPKTPTGPIVELPQLFACLRNQNLALVSAHRGKSDDKAIENSLSAFAQTHQAGPILIELDIAKTSDGEMVLMHDDDLARTTNGRGLVAQTSFDALQRLYLRKPNGDVSNERVPTLDQALTWGKRTGSILKLDLKPGVSLAEVLKAVRRNRMEGQTILISYGAAQARQMLKAAPDMMVSASPRNAAEWNQILALASPRLLVFTGIHEPESTVLSRLRQHQVSAITGTLGQAGQRLDDLYAQDGNADEYASLAAKGVQLIASNAPVEAYRVLRRHKRDGSICWNGGVK